MIKFGRLITYTSTKSERCTATSIELDFGIEIRSAAYRKAAEL